MSERKTNDPGLIKSPETTALRCERAKKALELHAQLSGANGAFDDDLTDLLTNLMHLAHRRRYSFDSSLTMARLHFEEEKQ